MPERFLNATKSPAPERPVVLNGTINKCGAFKLCPPFPPFVIFSYIFKARQRVFKSPDSSGVDFAKLPTNFRRLPKRRLGENYRRDRRLRGGGWCEPVVNWQSAIRWLVPYMHMNGEYIPFACRSYVTWHANKSSGHAHRRELGSIAFAESTSEFTDHFRGGYSRRERLLYPLKASIKNNPVKMDARPCSAAASVDAQTRVTCGFSRLEIRLRV